MLTIRFCILCPCHRRHAIFEFRFKQNICIIEHTIFQRNNDELKEKPIIKQKKKLQ